MTSSSVFRTLRLLQSHKIMVHMSNTNIIHRRFTHHHFGNFSSFQSHYFRTHSRPLCLQPPSSQPSSPQCMFSSTTTQTSPETNSSQNISGDRGHNNESVAENENENENENESELFEAAEEEEEDVEYSSDNEENNILQSQLSEANARNVELESELKRFKEGLARSHADLINLQKMSKKDIEKAKLYSNKTFARDMLTVIDSLESALKEIAKHSTTDADTDLKPFTEGIELTHKTIIHTFEKHGITQIASKNEAFNPSIHEALFNIETDEHLPSTVLEVVNEGYFIREQILRSAKVGVSTALPKIVEEAQLEDEAIDATEDNSPDTDDTPSANDSESDGHQK